jgi:hypothetical protein
MRGGAVVLRLVSGRRVGENAEDLQAWLKALEDCPAITSTVQSRCGNQIHAEDPATWFYVEADARSSIARRRCLSCGDSHDFFDSSEHWNAPRMWSCPGCGQSIAEVACGLHMEADQVSWVAVAARCVDCGTIDGLTDFNVGPATFDDVASQL